MLSLPSSARYIVWQIFCWSLYTTLDKLSSALLIIIIIYNFSFSHVFFAIYFSSRSGLSVSRNDVNLIMLLNLSKIYAVYFGCSSSFAQLSLKN